MTWTLPFANVQGDEAMTQSWRLLDLPAMWVLVLVLLPAIALVAAGTYWRERLPGRARWTLSGLRALSFIVLLIVIFRPVEVHSQERITPAEVLILADDSASMSRKDAYSGDAPAHASLTQLLGSEVQDHSRSELVTAAIERLKPQLEGRDYRVVPYRFHKTLEPLADAKDLGGLGGGTHIGDGLIQALNARRGQHVTDVVIVSDGRSNGGVLPLEAAESARAAGIPVHTITVGDTRPERNLTLELVDVPDSVLEGDEIDVTVRVRARGAADVGQVDVILEEIDPTGNREPRIITRSSVRPGSGDSGERVSLVAPKDDRLGRRSERRFRITVPPLPDERMIDDNELKVTVHVTPERIRVLYVDGYPRWEYRQLKDMLLRADERLQVQVYLMSATPDFPQEATRGMDRLKRVPTAREELLNNYDVIILGDVNPYSVSPDPSQGEEFVQSLFEFVERGGGLCVISGEYDMVKSVAGTEFAKLLPVKLDSTGSLSFAVDTSRSLRPILEDPVAPHEIVRLHPDPDVNRRLWEDPGGLRGFFWYQPTLGAKPGAQVLLRHPESSLSGGDERDPLLVVGYYPSGRTMFLALDETHRWQFRFEHRYHERFWRNTMRWLALGRLKGGDRRYQLEPLRSEYTLDQRVTLEARVLDEDFRPSSAESQEVRIADPDGEERTVVLESSPGRPGVYRASLSAGRPGTWNAWIEQAGETLASSEFEVVLPSRESADPSPDPQAMVALAARTGGKSFLLQDLNALMDEFPGEEERREPLASRLEDAWDHWGTLLLALGLLSLEWILRKRYELI
tara:strand:- start:9226 stop:11622 length:2397 start_codon:yes stop_codon:yes gene_type:complete